MSRTSRFSQSSTFSKNFRTKHLKYAHPTLEPLEERKLLTAATYINEIYFDPPGSGGDLVQEYIELRGAPGESMDNVYLIFIEAEDVATHDGEAGEVERIFDLSGQSLGSNGFLTLRQKGNPYNVHPDTTNLVNTGSGTGWGSGATSSLNTLAQLGSEDKIENSGFTAMLIVNNGDAPGIPTIGQDLDVDNDGLDVPTGTVNWTILDSIGVFSEAGEAEYGRLYAPVNFGPDEITEPNQVEGTYTVLSYEIEFLARYGNSIGNTAADWHISNLTDDPVAGFTPADGNDFRQSGLSHVPNSLPAESNQGVPVGTNLTYALGFANYPVAAPPILDLNGTLTGYGYATNWDDTGAVSITNQSPNLARVFNVDLNLVSLTATITTGADANNVLSADTTGTPISQSYNAGAGVLTLSGTATKAQYQQVLRTVKYDNSASGPGTIVTVELVGANAAASSVAATATIGVPDVSTVAGRHLFYNQSGTSTRYDGNNLAINASDDGAIASDKTAYMWENPGAANFTNISSYTKGINGIMVDITGSHPSITSDDFIFRVGNNNSPGTWTTANNPTSISVRAGAGVGGSDRVTIIWNGAAAPIKQWLQVIVLANADTGLAQAAGYPVGHGDSFFFGSAPGNTGAGDTVANALVTAADEAAIRANNAPLLPNIPITNIYDVGRNASVSALDESAARLNSTNIATTLKYLNLTSAPAAPEAASAEEDSGDEASPLVGDSGVASALTAPVGASEEIKVPGWIKNRLETIDLNSGTPARLFQHLHDVNTPSTRKLLQKFDAVADHLGLDDELLDELIAGLK